jgi:hypothetical protein
MRVARHGEEFSGRKAPYAPISALREFFERIRNVSPPARVDRRFFQKLSVAGSNEWALLSALKFLGIVDDNGVPTAAYRALQTSDRFEHALRELVLNAYKPLFDAGGDDMSVEDLRNYFRVTSSPSQAKNAARFFREVCQLAGLDRPGPSVHRLTVGADPSSAPARPAADRAASSRGDDAVLQAKIRLLEKMPPYHPEWSPEEYRSICDRFLSMLAHLDGAPLSAS